MSGPRVKIGIGFGSFDPSFPDPSQDLVDFSSFGAVGLLHEPLLGPLTVAGTSPWPWFDDNESLRGLVHGAAFPATEPTPPQASIDVGYYEQHYYDLTLTMYTAYYRTGDSQFLTYARKCADSWYDSQYIRTFSNSFISPRAAGYSGLMLRALDGRPEMWPGIVTLASDQYSIWLGPHLADPQLYLGIRDGGFLLRALAEIATAHPDGPTRTEFEGYALDTAVDYYARLQDADGGWYWPIDVDFGGPMGEVDADQPFEVGMVLEGLIATHQLTADATVRASILAAVDFLWTKGYDPDTYTNIAVGKRAMRYFVVDGQPLDPAGSALLYGMQDGAVRDNRQLNPTCIHAFGYAFELTSDTAYLTQGDEIFAASYGKGQGPGADAYYCLADYVAKNYNQAYRTAGRYLAWRAGA